MKELKGSNFLILFILLLNFLWIIPQGLSVDSPKAIRFFTGLYGIINIAFTMFLLVKPFLWGEKLIAKWGESVFIETYITKYAEPTYVFSVIMLIVYLIYQPFKKIIAWCDKYLTIKLNSND